LKISPLDLLNLMNSLIAYSLRSLMIDYICSKVDTYDLYASNIKKDIIITKIKS